MGRRGPGQVARAMVEVNLMGCLNAIAAVVPTLLAQGSGTISLVSSVAAWVK